MKNSFLPIKVRAESLVFSINKHNKLIERLTKRLVKLQESCKHPLLEKKSVNGALFEICPDCQMKNLIETMG